MHFLCIRLYIPSNPHLYLLIFLILKQFNNNTIIIPNPIHLNNVSIVMPMYFKQSKYTSFTRKLKRWGFTRVTTGAEQGAYYHKVSYIYIYIRIPCFGVMYYCLRKDCVSNFALFTLSQINKILYSSSTVAIISYVCRCSASPLLR